MTEVLSDAEVQPPREQFIDGLRGLAILAVITFHCPIFLAPSGGYDLDCYREFHGALLRDAVLSGQRGVQFFFMVSAFTLFQSTRARLKSDAAPVASFFIRRSFRILPLWWAACALYARYRGCGLYAWLLDATMLFGFMRFRDGFETVPTRWSIFVEEAFYMTLPLVFTLVVSLRRSLLFLAAACAVSSLWQRFAPALGVPTDYDFVARFPLAQWPFFAIGIVLYFLRDEPVFRRLVIDNRSGAFALDALAVAALALTIRGPLLIAGVGLTGLFIACMSPHTLLGKLSRRRHLGAFGVCCYSIYLFHPFVFAVLARKGGPFFRVLGLAQASIDARFAAALIPAILSSLLVGLSSWRAFERPCIELGRKVVRAANDRVAGDIRIGRPSRSSGG